MTYERQFGKPEGLRERLDYWIERLSMDQTLPWVGLGLIDDLKCFSDYMDGKASQPGYDL